MNGTRSYIAALGSSAALLGAVVVACAALSGGVGFNGFPVSTGEAGSAAVSVDSAAVPDDLFAAADPLLDDRGADAATPAQRAGGGETGGGDDGGDPEPGDDPAAPTDPGGDAGAGDGGTGEELPGGDGGSGGGSQDPPPEQAPTPPAEPPAQAPPSPDGEQDPAGPVGSTVESVDDVVGGVTGIDPGLGELTDPVTAPVDHLLGGLTGQGRSSQPPPVPPS